MGVVVVVAGIGMVVETGLVDGGSTVVETSDPPTEHDDMSISAMSITTSTDTALLVIRRR
jgi:hypothetical protein